MKGSLKARDCGSNTTASERLLAAAKRSLVRATQVEKNLRAQIGGGTVHTDATDAQSPVVSAGPEYIMTIGLGTPAKQFVVIADTGSDLNWVQCSPCTSCFRGVNPPFNPSSSNTYKLSTCSDPLCQVRELHCIDHTYILDINTFSSSHNCNIYLKNLPNTPNFYA